MIKINGNTVDNLLSSVAGSWSDNTLTLPGKDTVIEIFHRQPFKGSWGNFVAYLLIESDALMPKNRRLSLLTLTESWPRYFQTAEIAMAEAEAFLKENNLFVGSFWSSNTPKEVLFCPATGGAI